MFYFQFFRFFKSWLFSFDILCILTLTHALLSLACASLTAVCVSHTHPYSIVQSPMFVDPLGSLLQMIYSALLATSCRPADHVCCPLFISRLLLALRPSMRRMMAFFLETAHTHTQTQISFCSFLHAAAPF